MFRHRFNFRTTPFRGDEDIPGKSKIEFFPHRFLAMILRSCGVAHTRALVVKHHIVLSHQLHSVVIISSHVIGLELRTSHHIVSKQTISQRECARTRDHQECVTVTIRVQRRVSERLGEEAPFDQHVTTPHDAHDFITRPRGRYVIDPNSTAVDKIQAIQSS
jgi:hypothetical protein